MCSGRIFGILSNMAMLGHSKTGIIILRTVCEE
jgi:hypothetical protein